MQLKIDPEFQKLIPTQQESEYRQLEENILAEGCREPLVIWNGVIIDGHNRYKICTAHSIPFQTVERKFADRAEAIIWIIKNQFGRRNLLPFQRSELALKMKEAIKAKAKAKEAERKTTLQKSEKSNMTPVHTDEELSKMAGVSRFTIRQAEKIISEGTQEQKDRARAGGKGNTVNAIFGEIERSKTSERRCKKCGLIKPISEFGPSKKTCKSCMAIMKKTAGIKDRDQLLETIAAITEESRDLGREIDYTIDDFIEELTCLNTDYAGKVNRMVDFHKDLISTPGNAEKVIAALSEAETAIKKLRGIIS